MSGARGETPFAVFRCDASPSLGSGHLMRCLALADGLAEAGWRCAFATRAPDLAMVRARLAGRHDDLALDCAADGEAGAMASRWPEGCDLLVADHYGRDASFERACRSWARRIMVIDDLADRDHDCEVLLDQTNATNGAPYDGLTPKDCRLLLGPDFALLRPEFPAGRAAALARRREGGPLRRIMVSMGATDPHNVTSVILEGIAQSAVDCAIDVVLGAGAPHIDAVREQISRTSHAMTLHSEISNMAELMSAADLAIGAAGTTAWERCCLGLPALMVITADNQNRVATTLQEAGAALLLGGFEGLTPARVADGLKDIADDPARLRRMSVSAAALVDGRGVDRAYLAAADQGAAPLRLRLATGDDSALIFDWQCHPDTRRFARNPAAPTTAEHDAWMERTLADPGIWLVIVMQEDEPAGCLRFDAIAGSDAHEVSIYLAPDKYHLGIATSALKLAREIFPRWAFHAWVHEENTASHALFQRAGYRFVAGGNYVSDALIVRAG